MGRWRPPAEKSAPYITAAGYAALRKELDERWARRAVVTRALAAAAAEGDRSENAEYIYRKKELREIDRRIRYLQKRLPSLTVVTDPPSDPTRVFFGARVTVETEAGEEQVFRIVGPDEFDAARGLISMDSPLARALLKRSLDDEVEFNSPAGLQRLIVIEIEYPD